MTVELVVPKDAGGARLDRFLAEHAEIGSRAAAARLIDTGSVRVDGHVRPRAHRLAAGAVVELTIPEPETAPLPSEDVEVVYADDHLLVVMKPAGLLVHGVPGYSGPTLAAALVGRAGVGLRTGPASSTASTATRRASCSWRATRRRSAGFRLSFAGAGSGARTRLSCAGGRRRGPGGSRPRSVATGATRRASRSTPTAPAMR